MNDTVHIYDMIIYDIHAPVYHGTLFGRGWEPWFSRCIAVSKVPTFGSQCRGWICLNPQQWVSRNRKWCRIFFEGSHEFSRFSILCSMLPVAWHRHILILIDFVWFFLGSRWRNRCCRWYGWGERCKNPRGQSRYRFPESCLWIRWWGFLVHFVSLFATSFAGLVS